MKKILFVGIFTISLAVTVSFNYFSNSSESSLLLQNVEALARGELPPPGGGSAYCKKSPGDKCEWTDRYSSGIWYDYKRK